MLDRTIAPAINPIEQVPIPEAKQVTLDNGVSLFYINAGQQPVIRLEIIFMAGKWFEAQPGQSFFTAKMLTEGTESYSAKEIAGLFDEFGAFVDVTPGFDRVTVTIHLLTRHLQGVLPLVKEVISTPIFKQSELESAKKRKRQQLLVDLEKNNFLAAQMFTEKIFGAEHPYGRLLKEEQIQSIERQTIVDFFHQHFRGNYEVIMCGKVGKHEVDLVNRFLGQEPSRVLTEVKVDPLPYVPSYSYEAKENSLQSSIRLGMPFINRNHEEYLDMIVVNEILGGYFGSRLMSNIREQKGYTYGIRSVVSSLKHASFWAVSTDVKKQFWQQTLEEVHLELSNLKSHKVPEEELVTVKNYMLGTFVSSIDTPFALADKFKTIHYSGLDYGYFLQYFQSIKEIDVDRVLALSQKYLLQENITTVVVG